MMETNRPSRSLHIAVIGIRGIPARHGGFETCVDETSRRLVKSGHRVTVYCRKGLEEEEPSQYEQVELRYVPFVRSKNFATITASFWACLQTAFSDADVAHLYTVGTAIFIPLLRLSGKSVVVSVDALDWTRKKWSKLARTYLRIGANMAVRWANELVVDSKSIQRYYQERYGRPGVYVPFGANVESYRGSEYLFKFNLKPKKYILFVAILRPEKQPEHLIQAFNAIQQDEYDLVILGDEGDNVSGKPYVEWLKSIAGPRVRFMGRVYGEAYTQICQNAYLYVTPSEVEGTSPALLSAMGFGCCVLVNGVAENLETIGEAGLSYRKNDIQDLRVKLETLLYQPDVVASYGEKARERVRQNYDWDVVTLDFEAIYLRISECVNNDETRKTE